MKKCPYCYADVDDRATVCPHCRRKFKQHGIKPWIHAAGTMLAVAGLAAIMLVAIIVLIDGLSWFVLACGGPGIIAFIGGVVVRSFTHD